jgi:hypothetical protein
MTMTRTDVHSPTNMDPADYEYIFAIDTQSPWALPLMQTDEGRAFQRSLMNFAPETADRNVHQCHHCGAHIRYAAFLRHIPTGRTIVVGETCLDNRFSLVSKAEFDRLRKAAALDRAKQRIKTAAAEFVSNLGATDSVTAAALDRNTELSDFGLEGYGFDTVTDIRNKLWQYGSLSDKQVAFVKRLVEEAPVRKARREAIAAERAAEVKMPAPTGRQEFTGVVVSRKEKEVEAGYDFIYVWKLVVKVTEADGRVWLVYVSEPSKIETKIGDIVTMRATLKRSDRDESFAFGSRPSNAAVLGHQDILAQDSLSD